MFLTTKILLRQVRNFNKCIGVDSIRLAHKIKYNLVAFFRAKQHIFPLIVTIIGVSVMDISSGATFTEPSYRNLESKQQRYVPAELIKRVGKKYLKLRSLIAMVYDERDDMAILEQHIHRKTPIASLTKLMTAMVILDANLNMEELISITRADRDTVRYSRARLPEGVTLARRDMLMIALAASENRAALALSRTYPGGTKKFVEAMNHKARYLRLTNTHFADAAGLRNGNESTAEDLVKMVKAASQYTMIREFTTVQKDVVVDQVTGRIVKFLNTNRLVRRDKLDISLSKTGFTSDAGNCLVMKVTLNSRPLIIVLLNSWGKLSKYGDINRIKRWIHDAEAKARRLKLY